MTAVAVTWFRAERSRARYGNGMRFRSVVVSLVCASALFASCSKSEVSSETVVSESAIPVETIGQEAPDEPVPAATPLPCPNPDGSSPQTKQFPAPPDMCIDPAKTYVVTIETNKGTMSFEMLPSKAPKAVNSFVYLARYHYFDGIGFHRVVPDFVLQGGDPTGSGAGGPGYAFGDELPGPGEYKFGSLAMANAGPNTNGSQFFVISGPNGETLSPNYSLFGQLKEGEETVRAIAALAVSDGPPSEPVTMTKVTVTES